MQTFETIRTRMINQAAGRFHCRPETLQPEMKLLVEWMAWELYTLHKELAGSNDAIYNKIRRNLTPDTRCRTFPAHGLASAVPKQNNYLLRPDEDVFNVPRLGQEAPHQIFLSPLLPLSLVAARVKYLAYDRTLSQTDDFGYRRQLSGHVANPLHPGVLWIGIEPRELLPEKTEMRFCFDWKMENPARKQALRQLLPFVQWQLHEKNLPAKPGLQFDPETTDRHRSQRVDAEFLHLYAIEREVREQYDNRFVTIETDASWAASQTPETLTNTFGEAAFEDIAKQPVYWIRLSFPAGFRPEEIAQTDIRLNCFPVINRRLDKTRDFIPAGADLTEIIALCNPGNGRAALQDMGARFLGIQRIFSKNCEYRPVSFNGIKDAPRGSYALQHGRVEADDLRDLYARVAELTQLIETNASTLALLPQYAADKAFADFKDCSKILESAVRQIPAADPGYYLHLKVLDPQDMVFIRFWLTQGPFANGVAMPGDLLPMEKSNVLENDHAVLVTEVEGGCEPASN